MKKLFLFSVICASSLTLIQSCKKGVNDPFIALQTRTARLVNDWVAEKIERKIVITYTDINNQDSSIIYNVSFDGQYEVTNMHIAGINFDTTIVDSTELIYELKFKKDGSYVKTTNNRTNFTIETIQGNWVFLNKNENEELKNKEAILLTTSQSLNSDGTTTDIINQSDLDGTTLVLDRLTAKQLITTVTKSYKNDTGLQSGSYFEKITYKKR